MFSVYCFIISTLYQTLLWLPDLFYGPISKILQNNIKSIITTGVSTIGFYYMGFLHSLLTDKKHKYKVIF